jgi:hypothetical protein
VAAIETSRTVIILILILILIRILLLIIIILIIIIIVIIVITIIEEALLYSIQLATNTPLTQQSECQ